MKRPYRETVGRRRRRCIIIRYRRAPITSSSETRDQFHARAHERLLGAKNNNNWKIILLFGSIGRVEITRSARVRSVRWRFCVSLPTTALDTDRQRARGAGHVWRAAAAAAAAMEMSVDRAFLMTTTIMTMIITHDRVPFPIGFRSNADRGRPKSAPSRTDDLFQTLSVRPCSV